MVQAVPKQLVGEKKKRETLKLGSSAFSKNGLLLPQVLTAGRGHGVGMTCIADTEEGVLNP